MPGWQGLNKIEQQSDGKIVTAGYNQFLGGSESLLIMRNNSDGSPDSTFNANGILIDTTTIRRAYAMKIQPDGKILVGGNCRQLPYHFAIARYLANGTLDSTFGLNGFTELVLGNGNSAVMDINLRSDGKILVYGQAYAIQVTLACLNTDGSINNSFGVNGVISNLIGNSTNSALTVLIQQSGKIVVTASSVVNGSSGMDVDFSLMRYDYNVNTSINDTSLSMGEVRVYPNPFIKTSTIEFPNPRQHSAILKIYDFSGRLIQTEQTHESAFEINRQDYNDGIYYFTITNADSVKVYSGKIVVCN